MKVPIPDRIDPRNLVEARLLAHWAAQVPAALASRLVEPEEDDAHVSLEWSGDERGFMLGRALTRVPERVAGLRIGVGLDPLQIVVVEGERRVRVRRPLEDRTLDDALEWTRDWLENRAHDSIAPTPLPDWEMPAHPIPKGAPFGTLGEREGLRELGRWFAGTSRVLSDAALEWRRDEGIEAVSAVRLWPRRFDLTGVVRPGPDRRTEAMETIGFGFSPGNARIAQPHLFVTPFPGPGDESPLSLGAETEWREERPLGAVLRGEALLAPGESPWTRARLFLDQALASLLAL